jgi:hypothetical protein
MEHAVLPRCGANANGPKIPRPFMAMGIYVGFRAESGRSGWIKGMTRIANSGLSRCKYGKYALFPLCADSNHTGVL